MFLVFFAYKSMWLRLWAWDVQKFLSQDQSLAVGSFVKFCQRWPFFWRIYKNVFMPTNISEAVCLLQWLCASHDVRRSTPNHVRNYSHTMHSTISKRRSNECLAHGVIEVFLFLCTLNLFLNYFFVKAVYNFLCESNSSLWLHLPAAVTTVETQLT